MANLHQGLTGLALAQRGLQTAQQQMNVSIQNRLDSLQQRMSQLQQHYQHLFERSQRCVNVPGELPYLWTPEKISPEEPSFSSARTLVPPGSEPSSFFKSARTLARRASAPSSPTPWPPSQQALSPHTLYGAGYTPVPSGTSRALLHSRPSTALQPVSAEGRTAVPRESHDITSISRRPNRVDGMGQYRTDDPEEIPHSSDSAPDSDTIFAASLEASTPTNVDGMPAGWSGGFVQSLSDTPTRVRERATLSRPDGSGIRRVHGHPLPVSPTFEHVTPYAAARQLRQSGMGPAPADGNGTSRDPNLPRSTEQPQQQDTSMTVIPAQRYSVHDLLNFRPLDNYSRRPYYNPPLIRTPSQAAISSHIIGAMPQPSIIDDMSPQDEAFRDIVTRDLAQGQQQPAQQVVSDAHTSWETLAARLQELSAHDLRVHELRAEQQILTVEQADEARAFGERVRTRLFEVAPPRIEPIVQLRRRICPIDGPLYITYSLAIASFIDFRMIATFDWRPCVDTRGGRLVFLEDCGRDLSSAIRVNLARAGVLGVDRVDQIVGFEIECAVRQGIVSESLGEVLWATWCGNGEERMGYGMFGEVD